MKHRLTPGMLTTALLLLLPGVLFCQTLQVSGTVRDSITKQPLANVNVVTTDYSQGAQTDNEGKYIIRLTKKPAYIKFQLVGFSPLTIPLQDTPVQEINALLVNESIQLGVVNINSRKRRYSNKNNPAVELIRQVIAHKGENDIGAYASASYTQYEKLCMYFDKFPRWLSKTKLLNPYHFVFENKDTTRFPGKELIPVYIEETVSRNYFQRSPGKSNRIIEGQKKVDYGEFIDTRGISAVLNRLYEDINIYDNSITAFTRQFISPIANGGPFYYKYFIQDTVIEDGVQLIRLSLSPRNTNELLFTGTLYITLDGHYAIRKLDLHTNPHMNLGAVRSFSLKQDFERDSITRKYHLKYSSVLTDFGLTKGTAGMFGERLVSFSDFKTGGKIADSLLKTDYTQEYNEPPQKADSFFTAHRPYSLSGIEERTYSNIDSLHKMRSYRVTTDFVRMSFTGYKSLGMIDVGPVTTFLSYNPVEGVKGRIGGRTNTNFSTRYYLEGYLAYGARDQQWKYFGSTTYSLNNRSVYLYPMHYIRTSYRHDTNIPGTGDGYIETNILLALQTGANDKYLYNDIFRVDYLYEFGDHLSIGAGLKYKKQQPAGSLFFVKNLLDKNDTLQSLTTGELSAQFRWAPHEQFYQTGAYRLNIINRYPTFTLNYTHGFKGWMQGEYDYNVINAEIEKRFYIVPFGYADVQLEAGYITGQLPWPLLRIHAGNQTMGYSRSGYNMMNYLEFVSDHYAGISIDHSFKGFFFDRIPLIKKLKWREVASCKLLIGGLRPENMPGANNDALRFPRTGNVVSTYMLNGGPYFEAGAGIANIFKILRIDVIKRFTYLDHPGISEWSFRWGLNLEL